MKVPAVVLTKTDELVWGMRSEPSVSIYKPQFRQT
jgi:hypothetical protein